MSDHQQRGGDPTRFVGLLKGYEPAPLSGTGATPASVEVCERCGAQANPMPAPWFAPNDLWNEVHGSPNGFLCPACFADAADMKGISVIFKADRAGAFEDQEAEVERLRGERDRAIETRENANAASVRVEIETQRLTREVERLREALWRIVQVASDTGEPIYSARAMFDFAMDALQQERP